MLTILNLEWLIPSSKVYLNFDHMNTEKTVLGWNVSVYDINDKKILQMPSEGTDLALKSKEINHAKVHTMLVLRQHSTVLHTVIVIITLQ